MSGSAIAMVEPKTKSQSEYLSSDANACSPASASWYCSIEYAPLGPRKKNSGATKILSTVLSFDTSGWLFASETAEAISWQRRAMSVGMSASPGYCAPGAVGRFLSDPM